MFIFLYYNFMFKIIKKNLFFSNKKKFKIKLKLRAIQFNKGKGF